MVWWRVAPSMTNTAGPGVSVTESETEGAPAPETGPCCLRSTSWAHAPVTRQNAIASNQRSVPVLIDWRRMWAAMHRTPYDEPEPAPDERRPVGQLPPSPPWLRRAPQTGGSASRVAGTARRGPRSAVRPHTHYDG